MECPFCVETIKDESLVCRNCARDLTLVRPYIFEIQEMITEVDALQRDLSRARNRLAMIDRPVRFLLVNASAFVVLPTMLLISAHYLVTFEFDLSPIYLRVASVLIPLPFGFALAVVKNIGFRGTMAIGFTSAALSISSMLAVTSLVDNVNFVPSNWWEWRETLEYGTSIALAFGAGNILATTLFRVLPTAITAKGKPNPVAYRVACMLGQHVGQEALRRRARLLQEIVRTVLPLIGFIATASGSIYTGLKSVIGH
jgi:hypothetical protein